MQRLVGMTPLFLDEGSTLIQPVAGDEIDAEQYVSRITVLLIFISINE